MTREEAIKWLIKPARTSTDIGEIKAKEIEAYNVAIEALQAETDGELISRQDAIEALGEEPEVWNETADEWAYRDAWVEHISALKALPSAEPKTGRWIKAKGMMPPEFHGHHCCSECGNFANMEPPFGNREDLSNHCPNCGAKMEAEE